ncbi:MAG: hypothetical protein ACO3CW_06080 [Candidatus Nanopelagicaceae bacterium]
MNKAPVRHFVSDESGSFESHLTIIPLTILFLLTLQLTALASWQVGRVTSIEGQSNTTAITGERPLNSSATVQHVPLVGGGHVAVLNETREIPLLANFARLIPGLSLEGVVFRQRTVSLSEVYSQ